MPTRKILGVLGTVVGTSVVFTVSLVGGALLHLDLPAARRVVASQVGHVLGTTFRGKMTIERIGHIGPTGLSGVTVELADPDGKRVARLDGVSATLTTRDMLHSALLEKGDIRIGVSDLTVRAADISLDTDPTGALNLARAFESVAPSPPPKSPPGRGTRVALSNIAIQHLWAHGQMKGAPAIDADVDDVHARVDVVPVVVKGESASNLTIDVDRLRLAARGMPNGANPHGDVKLHVALPSASGKDMGLEASFAGDVAGIPATVTANMDGERVDAVADIPHADRERLHALVPNVPLNDDVSVHAEAHGNLPHLATTAHVTLGKGAVDAKGDITLGPAMSMDLAAEARHIDVHSFSESQSDLSADVKAKVSLDEHGAPKGTYSVHVLPGTVAGQRVPTVHLDGRIAETTITAHGQVNEPGAPTELAVTFRQGKDPTVQFEVHTHVEHLDRVPRVGPMSEGSAAVHINGVVALGSSTIDARVEAEGHGIKRDGVELGEVNVGGRVTGALTNPAVDVHVRGRELELQDRHFSHLVVHVRGPATTPVVEAIAHGEPGTPRIEAAAMVALGGGVTLNKVRVALVQPDATIRTRAERIHIGKDGIVAENTFIEGISAEPTSVRVEKNPRGTRFVLHGKGLEIATVARLARLDTNMFRAGLVDADVDLVVYPKGVEGTAAIAMHHAAVGPVNDGNAEFHATLDGTHVILGLHTDVAHVGRLDVHTSTLDLPGSPADVASWKGVTGKVHIDTHIGLARLAPLLPASVPVEPTSGLLVVEADIGRDRPDGEPDVDLSVITRKLALAGKTARQFDAKGVEIVAPAPWHVAGVDVAFDANIDGKSGKAKLATRFIDASAEDPDAAAAKLVDVAIESDLPYRELARHAVSGRTTHAVDLLERAPITLSVTLPPRKLAAFPEMFHTKGLAGDVDVSLRASGTALEPRIELEAHGRGVKREKAANHLPVSTDLLARYEAGKGQVEVHVRLPAGEVLALNAEGHGTFADLVRPPKSAPVWDASARAKITNYPLESVSAIADRQIRGRLSGELAVTDLHRNAQAHVQLTLSDLKVGRATYTAGKLAFDLDDHGDKNARATVRFDQKDGYAEVRANAHALWGNRLVPTFDSAKPVEAELKADSFRAAALLPFAEPAVSDLDGRIDADAKVSLSGSQPHMEGKVNFREGVLEIPAMGERLSGVRAAVSIDDKGLVRVDDIEARTDEGRLTGSGSAQLKGVKLAAADIALQIPQREAFPISLHGETLGETYGNVEVHAAMTPDQKTLNVDVDIPSMHVKLPETSTHSVLDLDRAEKIRVGVYRTPKQLTLLPLAPQDLEPEEPENPEEALHVLAKVKLGRDVEVKRGTDVKILLEGEPVIAINSETKMTGQIRLVGGFLEVQGKRFEIEHGTVTFTGEPNNPTAAITAGWTAPEGTRVYADFTGPIKTGKVNLRSEPARSKSDIFALILYGSDQGQSAPSRAPQDSTTQGVGVGIGIAGGTATQGLNKALSGLTGSDFATVRIDTSSSGNPRPEVEFQISRTISLQLATVFGRLPIDQPDRNFATVDWRFRRNWSVETTFGDQGSSLLDLIWQKRY